MVHGDTTGRSTASTFLVLILALAAGPSGSQTPIPAGGEFQVNTYTTDWQYRSAVSSDGGDGFVVVWQSYGSSGTDPSGFSIQGQRFAADGSPAGTEFQVNTDTTAWHYYPDVASNGADGFVVVWRGSPQDYFFSVQGQRYATDGSPQGEEFQAHAVTTARLGRPVVSADGTSGFVVLWDREDVFAQRFSSDGSPVGNEFQVNTSPLADYPAISRNRGGGFVVVWESPDPDGTGIRGQRFAPDGSPEGEEFLVNTWTTNEQIAPSVSPAGSDGFVVVWQSLGSSGTDDDGSSIQGQRYAADGSPAGGEFQVNLFWSRSQHHPSVSSDGAGGFAVAWRSDDLGQPGVRGRRYPASGGPPGDEFQVSTYPAPSGHHYPKVSPAGADEFVVVWTSFGSSGSDTSLGSVLGQRFLLPEIFADDFESGDTSSWSSTVP